ncbi:MAG: TonB family protein [Mojavia pulchra JT2-VF2]|jgi:TonB family protein|uniref:TonB family protein n=1 Tax=Mojavia pulchra JT2-VF2 TaxID=287848 RepID=A0A951PXN0_9NOST|nr:TonB family protein [Mojavia pulchra JT2-VF2]
MSFSSIAVAQREKEAETLKSFLAFSLIGSLILHLGVLASGITNLLTRLPELEEEAIELTLVEPTELETPKPPEEIEEAKSVPKLESRSNRTSSSVSEASSIAVQSVPKAVTAPDPVQLTKPVTPPTNTPPVQKLNNFKPPVAKVPEPTATKPQQVTESEKPVEKTTPEIPQRPAPITANTTPIQSSAGVEQSGEKLRDLLGGTRDLRATQGSAGNSSGQTNNPVGGSAGSSVAVGTGTGSGTGTGNGIGTGSGSGTGTGNGIGTGSGSGTGTGNGSGAGRGETVATGPTSPRIRTEPESRGSGNGRAACQECRTKYPEAARRRGIEGRVEVAVDTDEKGNVTNVRIARSSGNRDLDEETIRQAREWKLKPAAGGRQGVAIATEFALQGSRRHREAQARKKRQREAEQRTQQTAASNPSPTEQAPRRRRRLVDSNITDIPRESIGEPRIRRRQPSSEAAATTRQTESRPTPRSGSQELRESLRQRQRPNVVTNSPQQSQPPKNRRRRRIEQPTTPSQSQLLESLRRSRRPSQSTEAPAATGNSNE